MISSEAITFFYALRAEIKEEIYSGNCCLTLHLLDHTLFLHKDFLTDFLPQAISRPRIMFYKEFAN